MSGDSSDRLREELDKEEVSRKDMLTANVWEKKVGDDKVIGRRPIDDINRLV